jgi:Zn-dependent protease
MPQNLLPTLIDIVSVLPIFVVALFAITFHEAAHGFVAWACGDDTAKRLGRVSLNPIRHIDLIGTILLPAVLYLIHAPFLFGWAKPVPVDWTKLRHFKRDMMLVAAAGPGANFLLAGLSFGAIVGLFALGFWPPVWLRGALSISVAFNLLLGVFNLIPIPPLDGSKVLAGLLPEKWAMRLLGFGRRRNTVKWHRQPAPRPDSPNPRPDQGV